MSFSLMILAAVVAGINAQCVPQAIPHTETGDELCRVLLKDLADVEVKAANISRDAQSMNGCTAFQNLDFFTQLIVTINSDNTWLEGVINGNTNPTGDECVGVNTRIDFDVKSIQAKANTPVPGSDCNALTGSALSQYTLQRFGMTLTALASPNCGSGGKWAGYVKSLNDGIAALRNIIANNDAANCIATTKSQLGMGLKGILEAGGITSVSMG